MPSQSGADRILLSRSGPNVSAESAFERHEWELLTRLPARVMLAASAAEPDRHARTVADDLAGVNAVAAGAVSASPLVRAVVAAIYAEVDPDPPAVERDRAAGIADVLAGCRAAALVLDTKADPADALAYREWVLSIADRVCAAAHPSSPPGRIRSSAEQDFLIDLGQALNNIDPAGRRTRR